MEEELVEMVEMVKIRATWDNPNTKKIVQNSKKSTYCIFQTNYRYHRAFRHKCHRSTHRQTEEETPKCLHINKASINKRVFFGAQRNSCHVYYKSLLAFYFVRLNDKICLLIDRHFVDIMFVARVIVAQSALQ